MSATWDPRSVCDGPEHFGTPCSAEEPEPAKWDLILCDQHEIERRAELAGVTVERFMTNTGWPAPRMVQVHGGGGA